MKRLIAFALMLAVLNYSLPACGQDEAAYQQRERQSQSLEQFEGGFHELLIVLAVIVVVAVVLYLVLEEHHHHTLASTTRGEGPHSPPSQAD